MYLKYFYDNELAQASYLVGCAATGEALVIDPARDITPYLQAAAAENFKICHVAETHIHADFVSGGRELAERTGARLYLSQMGDAAWQYGYVQEPYVIPVRDGDSWMVGNLRLDVMHTPGHTPEHISFVITDTLKADRPMGIFTGDFVFVGDVGRPDLLEGTAGGATLAGEHSKEAGARRQFQSIQAVKALPDYLQIWPGHGAGSACGKALGAIPSTTLGYEKLFNPAFHFDDETQFVKWLLADQPEIPRYFAQMKRINKVGPTLLADLVPPTRINRRTLDELLARGEMVFDLRPATEYTDAHIAGTINIPATSASFTTYIGWFADYQRPLYLILPDVADSGRILRSLHAIGLDHVAGLAGPDVIGENTEKLQAIDAQELAARRPANGLVIVDVRGRSEYQSGHIAGARNIPLGFLPQHLDQLPHDRPIVVHCSSGYRSQIGASLLRAKGFDNVINLQDNEARWSKLLETVAGDPVTSAPVTSGPLAGM